MKQKIHQSLIAIGLCILIACNIVQSSSTTYNTTNSIDNKFSVSNASLGMDLSPFFDHLEEDSELYLQLNNTVDGFNADHFYHAFTNDPEFTIINTSYYARDLIYFLMGFGNLLIDVGELDYSDSPLWDTIDGGFFTTSDGTFTQVSAEKKVFDNLLYILALLEGAETSSNVGTIETMITSQWNTIVSDFWDSSNHAFNHSNANINERYSVDNFLGAMVAYSIAKSSLLTPSFRNSVKTYGDNIMTEFDSKMYDGISGQEGYYNTSNLQNNKIGTNNKNLLTNALGILALLEWNIQNDYAIDSAEVIKAEKVWRFLNTKLFNGSSNLYITETNFDGNIVVNPNMYLLQNAWMLRATLELFKHTGNTTYYIAALENFNGIEQSLHDSVNFGYDSRFGSSEKSLDGYGMLISSLFDFQEIFVESEIIIELNQSEYLYQIDPLLKFVLSYNITMDIEYPSIGESWSISAPISSADVLYVLRYKNNNTIVNIDSSTTNSTGQDEFTYDLSTVTSFYDFTLGIRCNRTGFNVGVETIAFPLSSGIEIVNIRQLETPLHQGDSIRLNITYTSSRPDDLNATTITVGENFEEKVSNYHIILREDEIDGKFESSVVVDVAAKQEASLGLQEIDIIVLNNASEPIFSQKHAITVYSVVEVSSILVNQYLINFSPTDLRFSFYNYHYSENETVMIELNSTTFEYSKTQVENILPRSFKNVEIPLIPNEFAKMGTLGFTVTITRDETVIYSQNMTIIAVPEIRIIGIHTGEIQILQGQIPTITIAIFNYNSFSKRVFVNSNGEQVLDNMITPGESWLTVELGNKIRNPYNIGKEVYEVVIKDEDAQILASTVITVNVKPSALNIFFFYVLPILIPIGVIVFFKYKELEQIKRTK